MISELNRCGHWKNITLAGSVIKFSEIMKMSTHFEICYLKWKEVIIDRTSYFLSLDWSSVLLLASEHLKEVFHKWRQTDRQTDKHTDTQTQISPCWTASFAVKNPLEELWNIMQTFRLTTFALIGLLSEPKNWQRCLPAQFPLTC